MASLDDGRSHGRVLPILGLGLYTATGWLYLGTPLVVPYPWVLGFWLAWIGGGAAAVRVARRRPRWTPVVAGAAIACWVMAVALGGWLLGWTA